MTCIIGFKVGNTYHIASDRQLISDDFYKICTDKHSKIFYAKGRKDILIGFSGSVRAGQIVEQCNCFSSWDLTYSKLITEVIPRLIKVHKKNNGVFNEDNEVGCNLLIVTPGRLFTLSNDFSVISSDKPFSAIGSGQAPAMAVLAYIYKNARQPSKKDIKQIFKIASLQVVGVSKQYDVLSITKQGDS